MKIILGSSSPSRKKLLKNTGIDFKVTDANSRMSKDANRLMKYLIELPIPQDLTDSNSITWGEDRANALELGALAVAQKAMGDNIGEDAVNLAQAAVTAMNSGIDIPGLKPETQGAVRAALSGAAIGCLLYTSPSPRDRG